MVVSNFRIFILSVRFNWQNYDTLSTYEVPTAASPPSNLKGALCSHVYYTSHKSDKPGSRVCSN